MVQLGLRRIGEVDATVHELWATLAITIGDAKGRSLPYVLIITIIQNQLVRGDRHGPKTGWRFSGDSPLQGLKFGAGRIGHGGNDFVAPSQQPPILIELCLAIASDACQNWHMDNRICVAPISKLSAAFT